MNTCHCYEDLFFEYADGEINREAKKVLEEHLRQCPSCAQKFGSIRELRRLLLGLPRVKVSSDFDTLLHARIRLENRRRRTLGGRLLSSEQFRLPAYALSFAIILIAVVLVFSKLSQSHRTLPVDATNLAVIENEQSNPASGLVTVYPIDRTSVTRIMGDAQYELQRNVASDVAPTDTLDLPQRSYPITQTQARVYQTTY